MKRYIKSSAGDVQLSKFVFIPSDKIAGVCEDNYINNISGYLWLWDYTYNTITHHTDDKMYPHSDVIDKLPPDLRKLDIVWGRVDWFISSKRLFVNDSTLLTDEQLNYIKNMCNI